MLVEQIALGDASEARAFKTATVTAFSTTITATIDGVSVTGIYRNLDSYPSPAAGHAVLLAVIRHSTGAVQYVALGRIG